MRMIAWTNVRRPKLLAALAVVVLLSCITTTALGSRASSGAAAAGRSGGKATILMPAGDPDHLDPQLWYTLVSWNIGFQICTTLVTLPDKGGQAGKVVVGGLANMPKVGNGGRTYTFTLRPGIKFSNGSPITPADIKWTFVRMLTPSPLPAAASSATSSAPTS
jgi:peptide/nickel transport system substrate-binding protein